MNKAELQDQEPSESLMSVIWRAVRRKPAPDVHMQTIDSSDAIAPLSMMSAIEHLSQLSGRAVDRAQLTAGLPVGQDLDARYVPFALARVGLEARWEHIPVANVPAADLPALIVRGDNGAVLVTAIDSASGMAKIVDAKGERDIPVGLLAGEPRILVCGHMDPENGTGQQGERELVRRNPRLWLMGLFLSERRPLAKLLVAALFLNLCGMAIPLYMRAIYDRVVPNLAIESLWALSFGMVIVLVFEFLFRSVRAGFIDKVAGHVGHVVQHRAMSTLLGARQTEAGRSPGALMGGLRDVEQLALLAPQALVTFLVDVPWFFVFLSLILLIGGWTVAGPVIGAAGMVVVGLIANYALKLASRRSSKLMQARNNLIVEVTEGWSTIKANQAEGQFLRQWDIVSDHIGVGAKAVKRWNELPGATSTFVVQLVTVLVVMIGVFQIKAGVMTTGAMVAVVMLTGRAMVPVSSAVSMIGRIYQSLSQFDGLAQILQMDQERAESDPSVKLRRVNGDIRVANLSHTFEGASQPSLNGVSLSITPGEKIALIGKSGSGKSTLLRLIAGLHDRQSGMITVDGHAIEQYAASHLRSGIAYAGQDATLFDRSIWENVLMGMPEPDEAQVDAAIRASGLDNFVSRTAEGYGRKIGPRGERLSGGQRQSLILARALVRNPSVLLLDEPTAAMDIQSEAGVIAGLREAAQDKTLVVATHRLALLDIVDRVIWLEEGRVVADKPRHEVLAMLRQANEARARNAG